MLYKRLLSMGLVFILVSIVHAKVIQEQGGNWAGWAIYDDQIGHSPLYTVNSINGSWIVENAIQKNGAYGSQWIGIGGINDTNPNVSALLIQIGTESSEECYYIIFCSPYSAWWETPENATLRGPQPVGITIRPGNRIYASITLIPAHSGCNSPCWELYMKDLNNSQIFIHDTTYVTNQTSAEWEQESLTNLQNSNPAPLTNFYAAYFGPQYTKIQNTDYANINKTINEPIGWYSNLLYNVFVNGSSFNELAYPTNVLHSQNNASFIVYEGPQLEMVGGLNVSRSMLDLGQEAAINGPHAEGGSGNYTYQWVGSCVAGA